MPAVIPWEENELQTLAADPQSRIFSDQRKITVVLQPFHLQDCKTAVRDLLNAGVNCYDKSLDGILLGYDKLKVLSKSASVSAETSGVAIEIQANFYTFRPEIGCILKGVANKISNDHVGILVYQRFNISCPRPGSEAKSSKWIGNNVVMHQEVVFKLKEKNFSGRLPFFKGKIMEIGNVVSRLCQQDKKSKKKLNEIVPDELNLSEASSQVTKKNRKHKLEESEENIEVKTKKSRKDADTTKRSVEIDADVSMAGTGLSPLKKKKKKVSIGSVDETDFIPRFSLDVSQLPEDLPPPNADSTHFDLTKNLSMSSKSDKKKKKKTIDPDLTAIREESADGSKGSSRLNDKSQQLNEEKTKKKLKTSTDEPCSSGIKDVPKVKTPKKKNSKEKVPVEMDLPPPNSLKKITKQADIPTSKIEESTPIKNKKAKVAKDLNNSSQLSAGLEKEAVHSEAGLSIEPSPSKAMKRSREDNLDFSPPKEEKNSKEDKFDSSVTKDKTRHENKLDSSPTKEKKKSRENKLDSSPLKEKTKEITSSCITSDDYIPPGQKSFKVSPKKQRSGDSPSKEHSFSLSIAHSPGMEYFAGSRSMMDPELGSRRSGRQVPLMFGSLEGKIPPPPESPTKSSVFKKVESDSDSDSLPPKKLVISNNSQYPSNSSDSDSDQAAAAAHSEKTVSSPRKPMKDNSDSSDSDTAVQNRLLLSMGVMQSPLKTAKAIVKHDSSESESEGSLDEDKPPAVGKALKKSHLKIKSQKPNLVSESNENVGRWPSPKKASKTNSKDVPKGPQLNQTKGQESDSDDELETMKAALLKISENKLSKAKTSKAKASKLNSTDGNASSLKAISEKKSPTKTKASPNKSKVNSAPSKQSDDSDSEFELMKSALLKMEESSLSGGSTLPKASRGKKSKPGHLDVSSKKTKPPPVKKCKVNPSDGISVNDPQVPSKVSKNKPENQAILSKKTKAAPVKKSKVTSVSQVTFENSKNKPDPDDSDVESDAEMMRALQKLDDPKPKDQDDSSKKTKSTPVKKTKATLVKKTKVKNNDNISKSIPQITTDNVSNKLDSDDEYDSELIRTTLQKLKEGQILGKAHAKEKAKKGKSKSANDISPSKEKKFLVKSESKTSVKLSSPRAKNISNVSYDSDSGPEDMNTTYLMEKMRQKRAGDESKTKATKSVKNQKNSVSEKSESVDSSKPRSKKKKTDEKTALTDLPDETKTGKSSKGNSSSKIAVEKNATNVKKTKGKKTASADDEISDVMQRLMRQAQLSVGLK